MLAIRMQRTGRKGHAMFRVVVQDSRLTPTSGKVVAQLGSYDPHAKTVSINKEKVAFYLEHGAQPSERVVRLIKKEGVKLPGWVKEPANKKRSVRNAEKRRSTAPAQPAPEPSAEAEPETPKEEPEAAEAVKPDAQPEETSEPTEPAVAATEEQPSEDKDVAVAESEEEPKTDSDDTAEAVDEKTKKV